MNTRFRMLIALFALLALVAACNGDNGDVDVTDDQTPADTDTEPDAETDGDVAAGDLEIEQEGMLRVGSDIDFPPFESYEGDEPVGFDIDLMEEIASRIGVEVEWVNASFDTIFTQLAGGEFDAIISAITITEERQQTIAFSDPYFAANQALVVEAGSEISSVDDLAGVRVGAQAGTTGLDYAQENFTEAEIVEFPTYPAAFTQLEAGQIDAVFADLPVAHEFADRSDALELAEEVETDELYGIGIQQDATNLQQAINDALAEVIDDGTYEEIYSTWFEGDPPEQFRAS